MSRVVLCRCKSHCTRYDASTATYVGPGVDVPSNTARRHAQEDQRAEALENFIGRLRPHDRDQPDVFPSPEHTWNTHTPSEEEFHTLQKEITERSTWSPTDRPLVFATIPGPMQEFVYPDASEIRIANHGPHALDPTNHANTAYIENETRLCELLDHLRELVRFGDSRVQLEEEVYGGLSQMWAHKEAEWNRRRYRSVAAHHGFPVVCTGESIALNSVGTS